MKMERLFPRGFLPATEQYDLSTKIDRWVFESIYAWMARRSGKQKELTYCSVNLSDHSLSNEDFLQFIVNRLNERKVPASNNMF